MLIGELSKKTGLSRDTIRFYERSGILVAVTRPHATNSYKEYGEQNVRRLEMVGCLKRLGFTLAECVEIIEARERGGDLEVTRSRFASAKLAEVEAKIEELHRTRDRLRGLLGL